MGLPVAVPRELRPYQQAAVAAVHQDWAEGTRRVGVVLPTGAGKSTVIAALAADAYQRGLRVVLLAHRGELLDQMLDAVRAVDPTIPDDQLGVVRAEQDDHGAAIVAATLQTLAHAHRRQALGPREVILWDEVHHAGAEGWHATFEDLDGYGDDTFMCGFTATMYRDKDRKGRGLGEIIQKISYERDLRWAIEQGYLVQPQGLTVRIQGLNALNDVRTVAGDFHQGQLAEVMEAATEYVVEAVTTHAADRRPIIFAASVDAAHLIADALTAADYPAIAVTGEQGYEQRQEAYHAYRAGFTKAIVTVMVLTEGADFPMCDAVVLARPTRSRNLYSQMVGRALRLYDGKDDALVLDLSGSTRVMKLVNLSQLDKDAPMRAVDETGQDVTDDYLDEIDSEPEPPVKIVRQGPVDMVTIDLLAGDDTLWLETPKGVPFINLERNEVVFLWPDDDRELWAVGHINTRTRKGGWAEEIEGEPPYDDLKSAIENAEEWAVENGYQLPGRDSSWRSGNRAPSEAQLRFARTLHIVEAEGMTKGRLSDEISIALAARLLDPAMEG
ncbi:DNA helicase [Gordonia phage MossRose]|nr:DNA helicase [Gordonia phage MossRose]